MNVIANYTFEVIKKINMLMKYAATEKLLSKLESLNLNQEIKSYILNLDGNLQGQAINKCSNQPNIQLEELSSFVEIIKEKMNKSNKDEFVKLLPDNIDDVYKKWFTIQLKKYPEYKEKILKHVNNIINFVENNSLDISSYNFHSIMKLMEQGNIKMDDPNVIRFFDQISLKEEEKLIGVNDQFAKYCRKKFMQFKKEWSKKIYKHMRDKNVTFSELISEANQMKQDFDNGLYLERALPNSPLMHSEHEKLFNNIENIENYILQNNAEYANESVVDLAEKARIYALNTDEGQYEPINKSDILIGPSNWGNEDFNGYFILDLKSPKNLIAEGIKMSHCVGTYVEMVKNKSSVILSVRNVSNPYQPLATIEMDKSLKSLKQCQGPRNTSPSDLIWSMVKYFEYKTNDGKKRKRISLLTPQEIEEEERVEREKIEEEERLERAEKEFTKILNDMNGGSIKEIESYVKNNEKSLSLDKTKVLENVLNFVDIFEIGKSQFFINFFEDGNNFYDEYSYYTNKSFKNYLDTNQKSVLEEDLRSVVDMDRFIKILSIYSESFDSLVTLPTNYLKNKTILKFIYKLMQFYKNYRGYDDDFEELRNRVHYIMEEYDTEKKFDDKQDYYDEIGENLSKRRAFDKFIKLTNLIKYNQLNNK